MKPTKLAEVVRLDLTPRIECPCGALFRSLPADECDTGALGQSTKGLCQKCADSAEAF